MSPYGDSFPFPRMIYKGCMKGGRLMKIKSIKALSMILAGASFVLTIFKDKLEDKIDEHDTREIVRDEMKKIAEESDEEEES